MKTGRLTYGIVLLCSLILSGQQPETRGTYALHDYNLFQQGLTAGSWLSHSETEKQNLIELIASTMRDITQSSQSEAVVQMAQKVLDAGDKLRADRTNQAKLEEYVSAVNYFKGMPPEQLSLKKHEMVFEEIPPKIDYIIKNGKILGGTVTYYPNNATWWTGYAHGSAAVDDNIDVGQGTYETCRGWIKFNTSPTGLPSGSFVTGATLKGYCSKAANATFYMKVVRMHVDPVPATFTQIYDDINSSTDYLANNQTVLRTVGSFSIPYTSSGIRNYLLNDLQSKTYHAVGFQGIWEDPADGWGRILGYSWPWNRPSLVVSFISPPTLSSPGNGSTGISLTPTLNWNAESGALVYKLEVATNTAFNPTVYSNSNITSTSQQITPALSSGTTYYWRVSAGVGGGWWTTPSSAWGFTTIATPTLSSPANWSTGISLTPTLSWNAVSGATSYKLEVATNTGFSPLVYSNSNITSTAQQITSALSSGSTYYWRVTANNAFGSSAPSSAWGFTTIAAPALSSPGYGSTGISITPTLSWNVTSGATKYNLQVAEFIGFSSTVYSNSNITSTSQQVTPALSYNTEYFWRVCAIDAAGNYSNYSDRWSFKTIPAAPALSSPGNGSTGISVTPTLSWSASSGATKYQLEVATNIGFSPTVYSNSNITSISQQITSALSSGTTYYWRVSAYNGAFGAPSSPWSFTTVPAAPALSSPANGSTGISRTPTLSWNATGGATSYKLEVAENTGFSPTVYSNSNITSTSQQVALAVSNNILFYWRVSAYNGGFGVPSSTWSFSTIPIAPKLLSPDYGSAGVSTIPTLSWSASTGATKYKLEIATNTGFSPTVYSDSNITSTSQQITPALSSGTTYYWRVYAIDYYGASSAPSSTWSFTTLPAAPELSLPAWGSTGIPLTPTLSWNASSGATSYKLEVATNTGFSPTVYSGSNITSTSQQVTLSGGTTYYWRVYAYGGAYSAPSSVWSFSTILAAPSLSSPANAATGISLTPTLSWNASSGATSYLLEVATNYGFSPTVYANNNITSTSQQVTPALSGNTTYCWRVTAYNDNGTWSDPSPPRSFTTILAAPALCSPTNGSTGLTTAPTLRWYRSGGATNYQLDLSNDSLFSLIAMRDTTITDTVKSVTGLLSDTTYYWRLYAKNIDGKSGSSAVWRFSTISEIQLDMTSYLQGFYSGGVMTPDTVTVYLANRAAPYLYIDSAKVIVNAAGHAIAPFYGVLTGQYYIVLKHRNSIETWSKPGGENFVKNVNRAYNFSTDSAQAYGENLIKINGKWCIYSGDVNQDGIVDYSDLSAVDNDSYNFISGYVNCDVTGDQFVDYSDLSIVDNNSFNFISVIRPGLAAKPVRPVLKIIERSK